MSLLMEKSIKKMNDEEISISETEQWDSYFK
jgi:hypothetical protein